MPSLETVLLIGAILILALGFGALLVARFSAIYRRRIMARWPAFALGALALIVLLRGGVEPSLVLGALAFAAWFVSPALLAPKPAPVTATPTPADAQARAVLGVGLAATPDDIRAAYRRKMADAHPDRGGSHDAAARLTAARDTLLKARR